VAPKGCIKKTKEWPKWQHHFEQYQVASGLAGREEVSQVSTFLYCLGEDAEDIPDAIRISTDDKTKYGKEVEAFNNYFKIAKKNIFERAHFNKKNQLPNKSTEQFITVIHRIAVNCKFGNIKDKPIRDKIVVVIRTKRLSECQAELTLDKAKQLIKQYEGVREQWAVLKTPLKMQQEASLDAVVSRRKLPTLPTQVTRPASIQTCQRCGRTSHHLSNTRCDMFLLK